MEKDPFIKYLQYGYKGKFKTGLTRRVAGDVCSRCLRVERVLRVNLDRKLTGNPETLNQFLSDFESQSSAFQFKGAYAKAGIKSAIRLYNLFINFNKTTRY
jgi:hypothetical protein